MLGSDRIFQECTDEHLHINELQTDFISSVVAPFSPIERYREEIAHEFRQACKLSISNILPWSTLIEFEVSNNGCLVFDRLRVFVPSNHKLERISKFQHLLHMENEGKICLKQTEHSSEIRIISKSKSRKLEISIKDRRGQMYCFDWKRLTDSQRDKIIMDTLYSAQLN